MILLILLGFQPQDIQMWLSLIVLLLWGLKRISALKIPKWLEVLSKAIASLPEEAIEMALDIFW